MVLEVKIERIPECFEKEEKKQRSFRGGGSGKTEHVSGERVLILQGAS